MTTCDVTGGSSARRVTYGQRLTEPLATDLPQRPAVESPQSARREITQTTPVPSQWLWH